MISHDLYQGVKIVWSHAYLHKQIFHEWSEVRKSTNFMHREKKNWHNVSSRTFADDVFYLQDYRSQDRYVLRQRVVSVGHPLNS